LALALSASACGGDDGPAPARNVLLISIDTLRADHLGCYGYERPTSPTLDAVASAGVLFERASSTSPWTLPAHASMLTGLYPSRNGVRDCVNQLPEDVPTLATRLAARGMRTLGIVNSLNVSPRYGFRQGFEFFGYMSEWDDPESPDARMIDRGEDITSQAIRWLAQRTEGEPFFLFLHYYDVHGDYAPKEEYRRAFVRPYDGPITGESSQLNEFRAGERTIDEAGREHLIDLYDAGIRQLDAVLARLFGYLETSGLDRDTLVVITSDHGEEFLEHGSVLHGRTHFEELISIPLLLRGPGVPQGLRIPNPVSLVDVVPTILSLLGLPAPDGLDGIDLTRTWAAPDTIPDRLVFSEADHTDTDHDVHRMARDERYKLHLDTRTDEATLYDLHADPDETHDIAPTAPTQTDRLLTRLRAFMAQEREAIDLGLPSDEELDKLRKLGYVHGG
jgi:arylsulfatase A-like enzyme